MLRERGEDRRIPHLSEGWEVVPPDFSAILEVATNLAECKLASLRTLAQEAADVEFRRLVN